MWLGSHLIASGNTKAALEAEISRAKEAEGKLAERIAAFESGDNSVASLIQNAIETASAYTDTKVNELATGAVASNTAAIETLNGDAETDGSVAKAVADVKTELLGDAANEYNTLGKLEDKVLAVEAAAKSYAISAITVNDTNVEEAWGLFDEDGVQAGATIKIYKDSSLKEVKLDGQVLNFTYLMADGSEKTVGVNVSTFLAESEFKDGLQVNSGEVSVKIAEAAVASTDATVAVNKNFLELEGNDDENKAMAVRSIDTDCTILQKDIVVAGLSTQFGAGNYTNNQVIPAGTDIYTILQNILCKELYPTNLKYSDAAVSTSISAPSVTFSGVSNGDLVEIGSVLTMNAVSTSAIAFSTTPNKVSGLTYGYSATDDDAADSTATTISKTVTTSITDNTYSLEATVTKFSNTTIGKVSGTSSATIASQTMGKVEIGENSVTIKATGAKGKGVADALDAVYLVSNLGNTDASKKSSSKAALDKTCDAPVNSTTFKVIGVYPVYNNIVSGALAATASNRLPLTSGKTFEYDMPSEVSSNQHFMFEFPAKYSVSTFKVKDLQGNFVSFAGTTSTEEIGNKDINGVSVAYKRFSITGDMQGEGTYQITLSGNLNA